MRGCFGAMTGAARYERTDVTEATGHNGGTEQRSFTLSGKCNRRLAKPAVTRTKNTA